MLESSLMEVSMHSDLKYDSLDKRRTDKVVALTATNLTRLAFKSYYVQVDGVNFCIFVFLLMIVDFFPYMKCFGCSKPRYKR